MIQYKRKSTGEGVIFELVWENRPHVSVVNGAPITQFEYNNKLCFAHVLNKRKYPLFRLYEKNMALLKHDQHTFWDNRTEEKLEARMKDGEDWEYMMDLEAELIEEYKEAETEWNDYGEFRPGSKFYGLKVYP